MVNEPSFTLDAKNGGLNWGYCIQEKKAPPTKFYAIVDTSSLTHSETNSEISIQLFGDKGEGEKTILNKDGFDKGISKKLDFLSKDVGDLQKIKLFLKGQQAYRCKTITIIRGSKRFIFHCLRPMAPCTITEPTKCQLEIAVDGQQGYEVTIETGDEIQDGTKSPIHLTLIGDKALGQQKIITEFGLKSGSSKTFTVNTTPIGKVVGFIFALEGLGKWKPIKVSVIDLITKEKIDFPLDNVMIMNPGSSPYVYNTQKKEDSAGGNKGGEGGGNNNAGGAAGGSEGGDGEGGTPPPVEELNVNDPNGGLMPIQEKKQIIDLKCEQVMVNPDEETNLFGPDYPTKDVNYSTIIVRCPANCHKSKNIAVYGLSIHPVESPICFSAIVDGAMSYYGGIFSISVFSGYEKYELPTGTPPKLFGIDIKPFGPSKKSYVLAKIDNVDIVEKDIRIINSKGELSASGRLEMRYEGVWGTICSRGNNRRSAKVICSEIGYRDGEWKNPENEEGKDFCRTFNDEDHCGAEASRTLFSNIVCEPNDNTINQCSKVIADPNVCGKNFDAIINCYNDNYSTPVIIPNKTIRLESSKKAGTSTIGRLELYFNNKYAPVCNIGYNEQSALISCKQMGFTEGKVVTDKGVAKDYQLAENSKEPFNAVLLTCKGEEANVGECKMTLHDITCLHSQDVVIECVGPKGDVSGISQYVKKDPVPPPKLGKLGIASRVIDCDEKGYDMKYRGDPGSIYALTCPANCGDKSGMLWGTGVFTSDSFICKSALHAGIIGPSGGEILYIKSYGQKKYIGSVQNGGYLSAVYERDWPSSFSLSQMNLTWKNMLPLTKPTSFLQTLPTAIEWSSPHDSYIQDNRPVIYKKRNRIKVARRSSFIQLTNDLPEPLFKWTPPTFTFEFTPSTNITFDDAKISNIKDYTIIFSFKLKDFKNEDSYLFSYNGCGGFNIYVAKNGILMIGDFCDKEKLWSPGYNVPINDNVLVYIRYKQSHADIKIKSDKVKDTFDTKILRNLDIGWAPNLAVGRIGTEDANHFLGTMQFFYIFNGEVPMSIVPKILSSIKIVNINATESFLKTVDDRMCVSRCSDNPIPPNPGCGEPPKEADPNGAVEPSGPKAPEKKIDPNNNNSEIKDEKKDEPKKDDKTDDDGDDDETGKQDNQSDEKGGDDNKDGGAGGKGGDGVNKDGNGKDNKNDPGTYDKNKKDNIETLELTCESDLLDKKFAGAPGKIFRCKCPSCNAVSKAMVYGTDIYHPKSSICKAAQHAGALKPGEAGDILVTLIGPKPIFNGSEGDDKSMSGTFSGADRAFSVKTAKPLTKIPCAIGANKDKFAKAPTNEQFVVLCPSNCSKIKNLIIFGTETYTDTSPICLAAIHRGIINDKGGEVKFVITVGKDNYKGSNGFGIASKDFGPHVRSYEFLGVRAAIDYSYTEDYEGKFPDKWKLEKHPNPKDPNSDSWDFYVNPNYLNKSGVKEKIQAIRHTGKITANNEFNFGSWVILNNAEWANGTVRFNLLFKNPNPVAFFFRYKDKNNYYGVQFSQGSPLNNIKLMTRVEGNDQLVKTKSKPMQKDTWYRIKVVYDFDLVKVYIQSDNIREQKLVFRENLKLLTRGTIAFATKGNDNFLISGINVSKVTPPYYTEDDKNKVTWKEAFKKMSKKDRKDFCTDIFVDDDIEINRCSRPHVFCKYKCDGLISNIFNILNYQCYQDCVRESKVEETALAKPKDTPVNFLTWVPKLGSKCDYKPSGEKVFVNCVVKELTEVASKKFAQIEYQNKDGSQRQVYVEYPNMDLLECGKGLKIRTDCDKP